MSHSNRPRRAVRRGISTFALLLCLSAGAALAQPTVNGLFYGDGDDAYYVHWATSELGSKLYVYLDVPTTTLYVALVVDRSVNDNVFGASHSGFSGNYMSSAGWGGGGGQQRSASALTNSEFASFEFACEENSPRNWAWQQGYACLQAGTWVSDSSCPTSAVLMTGYPPTLQTASSFVLNINTWNAQAVKPWNLHVFGTAQNVWKSPFSATDPNTTPPNNPNTVIGLEGYPASGQITYNSTYLYEWPMVYEWSIDVGSGGANCDANGLFLVTGASHHSPMKDFWEENNPCPNADDDCFPPGGGEDPFSDFGDLPTSYGTLSANNGAQHHIVATGPYLGDTVELEVDGQPTSDATGDGSEEDGVTANVTSNWTVGSTQSIDVDVANAPSGALLGAWFDWNGDGDFADAGEFFSWTVSEGTNTLNVTVGSGFDWQSETLYARFRIFSSAATVPGGSLTQADFVGTATDGEVEDYVFAPGTLPVTLNAFTSEGTAGGEVTVRWQTASETDNVAFELWGRVGGQWHPLTELIQSQGMSSALPQRYEARISAPPGLTALRLVDYDSRGRVERFGSYRVGESYGEFQRIRPIDWSGPRAERAERLRDLGFTDTARGRAPSIDPRRGAETAPAARWKKLRSGEPVSGSATRYHGASAITVEPRRGGPDGGFAPQAAIQVETGPMTHVAVTEPGIQRVTYEALRAGGLDLAGVHTKDIAVTWRGQPVDRWIDGPTFFGPGSAVEFLGFPPAGDDALYIDANLYQVAVDSSLARDPRTLGQGKAKNVSASYLREAWVDRPLAYHHQSPTGDPWIERSVLVRGGQPTTVTLDLPIEGPMAAGPSHLVVGLGAVTNLPDLVDAFGSPIPEHNVEVWARGPSTGFTYVSSASASGHQDWTLEATVPAGLLAAGVNQVQLRFSTQYFFSLVVVDRYGARYPSPYHGPTLDFAPDRWADGYRVDGLAGPSVVAYAQGPDGSLTRVDPRLIQSGAGYAAELRQTDAVRYWVTEAPHAPEVFTTEAPPDLLAGPAGLVVVAGSSFVGSWALDDYLAQKAAFDPVVVDVEDVYNAVGFGMALPSAITDYLAARDAIHPFSHVQLVGTDCYDRLGYISQCLSFIPLPTAPVNVNVYSPSQNRLVDLDSDGVADKAVAQYSVREEAELATIVAKGASWDGSALSAGGSALLIAEESDGLNDFSGQIDRLSDRLGWSDTDRLHMADHPNVLTARSAMSSSLDAGRAVTVFSGHSSPTVWAFRSLLTASGAAALTNHGRPTIMVPLACETTYDISPNANVLGHQLLYAGANGAVAISGAVALSSLDGNELMANHVLDGLKAGLTLGEAVLAGRRAIGSSNQELQDNWLTQGDVTVGLKP
jgi:hypothetical protein